MTVDSRKIRLIMDLRREGIIDTAVLAALERTPREAFVLPQFLDQAYENSAFPIACGQTISQPYVVAYMLQTLNIGPRMKVLEVGTGSGYQTAILSKLCRRIYTIERERDLLQKATQTLDYLKVRNYTTKLGDGSQGWKEQAPFDRIIVSAAPKKVPQTLLDQLADNGRLVIPVGETSNAQRLVAVDRKGDSFQQTTLIPVRFVPLLSDQDTKANPFIPQQAVSAG